MTVQQVGSTPVFVSGKFTRPYTVRNAGAKDVYLGTDSSLSLDARALTLVRGASMQWNGGSELWALCAPNESSTIEYIYEGGSSVTDGATVVEISGPVTLDGPVSIEGTVPVSGNVGISGGSVSIVGGVTVDGDINVDGSTINVGNSVGIANIPTLINGVVTSYGAGAGNQTVTVLPVTDLSGYVSVKVVAHVEGASSWLPDARNYVEIVIKHSTPTVSLATEYDRCQWLLTPTLDGTVSFQVPIKAANITITARLVNVAGENQNVVSFAVLASSETVAANKYVHTPDGFAPAVVKKGLVEYGLFSETYNNVNETVFMGSKSGAAYANFSKGNNLAVCQMNLHTWISGTRKELWTGRIETTDALSTIRESNIILPYTPLGLQMNSAGTINYPKLSQ